MNCLLFLCVRACFIVLMQNFIWRYLFSVFIISGLIIATVSPCRRSTCLALQKVALLRRMASCKWETGWRQYVLQIFNIAVSSVALLIMLDALMWSAWWHGGYASGQGAHLKSHHVIFSLFQLRTEHALFSAPVSLFSFRERVLVFIALNSFYSACKQLYASAFDSNEILI
jgi:hypothetical protein